MTSIFGCLAVILVGIPEVAASKVYIDKSCYGYMFYTGPIIKLHVKHELFIEKTAADLAQQFCEGFLLAKHVAFPANKNLH